LIVLKLSDIERKKRPRNAGECHLLGLEEIKKKTREGEGQSQHTGNMMEKRKKKGSYPPAQKPFPSRDNPRIRRGQRDLPLPRKGKEKNTKILRGTVMDRGKREELGLSSAKFFHG